MNDVYPVEEAGFDAEEEAEAENGVVEEEVEEDGKVDEEVPCMAISSAEIAMRP